MRQKNTHNKGPKEPLEKHVHARTRNISNFMKERLSPDLLKLLREIGVASSDLGYQAYVVGGFVRDLFLYRVNEDVDIVIEDVQDYATLQEEEFEQLATLAQQGMPIPPEMLIMA